MRIRAAVTLALAALALAVLMAMPALAAKPGKQRPYKSASTQTGTFNLFNLVELDLVGPMIASHLGKGSVRTVNTGAGNESIYTAANGDMLYSTEAQNAPPTDVDCPAVPGFGGFGSPFPSSVTVTFNGGTGRFANATGMAVSIGCFYLADFDPLDPSVDFALYPSYAKFSETGWLSY